MKLLKKILFLAVFIIAMNMGMETKVYAAEGRMIISLSDKNIGVGNTVKVTLSAIEISSGEKAITDMEFTYDTSVFSFVSCDSDNYSGGADGKVLVRGERVNIILKAIGNGSGRVVVKGSNGKTKESGAALGDIEAAGVTIQTGGSGGETTNQDTNNNSEETTNQDTNNSSEGGVNQNNPSNSDESVASNDNSLASLSLSAGELSPEFSYATTEYTAKVPYNVTGVEVHAQTTAGKAQIEAIAGNKDLQVGENTITVTVKAENGAKALYTIVVTREAKAEGDSEQPEQTETSENIIDNNQIEEYESKLNLWEKEYNKLNQKYEEQKSNSIKIIIILVLIILILIIVCVNLLFFRGTRKGKNNRTKAKEKRRGSVSAKNKTKKEEWLDVDEEAETKKPKASPKTKKTTSKRDVDIIDFDEL